MNIDFGPNFSGFFVRLLLTNERASDWNISGAYTRGSKEDLESVLRKIPYEHTSDLHCKLSSHITFQFEIIIFSPTMTVTVSNENSRFWNINPKLEIKMNSKSIIVFKCLKV